MTGYLLSYTDQTETITHTLLPSITRFAQINTNCEESMNISLQAESRHLSSIPVTVEFILRKLDCISIVLHIYVHADFKLYSYIATTVIRVADILLVKVCVHAMYVTVSVK